MHPEFQIDYRYSAGNLHIQLSGAFSRVCAWALFKTIKPRNRDAGAGRIFVDTGCIDKLLSAGVESFKAYMTNIRIKPDWLYFKGEKGFAMAPDGSRVLIRKKSVAAGDGRASREFRCLNSAVKTTKGALNHNAHRRTNGQGTHYFWLDDGQHRRDGRDGWERVRRGRAGDRA